MTGQPDPAVDEVTLRLATVSDAAAVYEINLLAWQQAYRGILPDAYLDNLADERAERTARWGAMLADPEPPGRVTWVVADSSDRPLGYVVVGPSRDEESAPGEGELWAIYVHPSDWRTGTGSILMGAAVGQLGADGYTEAILWVFEANKRARAFYERHGWRHDGGAEIFERGGQQAIEFRYRLPLA
ncbi:MAG TPA: GNAT family N-acetyltransferase [Acidimicrobiales bacterium]|jgi:GNAT superfamily N-acetyltransferase|nr:GNAT family N-acetyltransferase [Acidimicrobiales bacterium]